ncbi:hypothetical protein RSOLAG1IB_03965 [Rhizoctonia solani AG-1 IB]|uniref:Uncharacterized protein n=1 Tax=Thanatephorus cucumeris (strain AG1-IB / isolate 7/3/14) TaxID=1108050 RepID=A0A0B7FRX0_THACB|nr:hypothetical protein RSOLAG1IB_03965 [Rhizoctonia solani AG-1 IB]
MCNYCHRIFFRHVGTMPSPSSRDTIGHNPSDIPTHRIGGTQKRGQPEETKQIHWMMIRIHNNITIVQQI